MAILAANINTLVSKWYFFLIYDLRSKGPNHLYKFFDI